MRNILYGILLTVLSSFTLCASGQSVHPGKSEQEIKSLLSHKWYPDTLQVGGEKISASMAEVETAFYYFHSDGTFTDESIDKYSAPQKVKWYYDHKAKTITLDVGMVMKLLLVTDKKLVFSTVSDGQKVIMSFKRSDKRG